MARRCEGKPQDVEGNNTVGREVGWAKQKHNCGSRLVPGWFQVGARLVPGQAGWNQVGTRLVPGWFQVGARLILVGSRLVPGWSQVGSRLVPGWFQGKKHICQGKNQGLKGKLTFWRKCEGKTDNQRIMQGKPLKHYNIPTLNGGSIGMSVWQVYEL